MGFSVRGHICIRRKAKDGEPGAAGKSIRTTVWEAGKQYYAGDTQVDGVYPLDIVSDKAMSIGVSGVNFYMCRTSHTSSANIPLTNTAYWTKLNNLKPVVTYLILAEAIKANYIDVADLAANSAFIENLVASNAFITSLIVSKLRVKDANDNVLLYAGDTTYPLMAGSDVAANAVSKIGADGKLYSKGGEIGGFIITPDSIGSSVDHVSNWAEAILKMGYAYFCKIDESSGSGKVTIDCNDEPRANDVLVDFSTANNGFDYNPDIEYIGLQLKAGSVSDTKPIAIKIKAGRVHGLRPKVRTFSGGTITLDEYDFNVLFRSTSTNQGTINLPSSPQAGQMYTIYCCTALCDLLINANGKNIKACGSPLSDGSSITVSGRCSIQLVYNGTYWVAAKIS